MLGRTKTRHIKGKVKEKAEVSISVGGHKYVARIPASSIEESESSITFTARETIRLVRTPKLAKVKSHADVFLSEIYAQNGKSGTLLRGLRERENMTQAEFAKEIGIDQARLSKLETGAQPVGKKLAQRIGERFKVEYRIFL